MEPTHPTITQDGADTEPGDDTPEDAPPQAEYVPDVAKAVTRPLRMANRAWPPEADPQAERRWPTCPVAKCRNQVGNAKWIEKDRTDSGRPIRRTMCQCHVCGRKWEVEVLTA